MKQMTSVRWGAAWALLVAICAMGLSLSLASPAYSACPNEGYRTGQSAELPDCRAYELVTPHDSNGRVFTEVTFELGDVFPLQPASSLRESFVFSVAGKKTPLLSPGGANGLIDSYETVRSPDGWQVTRRLTPSGSQAVIPIMGGVSADHEYAFSHVGPVEGEAGSEFGSLYEGDDADYLLDPEGSFNFTGVGTLGTEKRVEGRYISPGGGHVIFTSGHTSPESEWCALAKSGHPCPVKKLEQGAAQAGTGAVYDRSASGSTHVVSLLPGDVTPGPGQNAIYKGASADGSVVAFTVNGVLYVRVDDTTTEKVSEEEPDFGGLSAGGKYAFYVKAGNIRRLDTESKANTDVSTSGDSELVNVSSDGSHAYFVSKQQLVGVKGTVGQPNLYVWSTAGLEFIATLLPSDAGLTNWITSLVPAPAPGHGPGINMSRSTPDGRFLLFVSKAELTSYDNNGHKEIYRYDAVDGELTCVSCNPQGIPATADAKLQDQQPFAQWVVINNLSEDGRRAFFETTEALVEADTDGVNDVYEWSETGEGTSQVSLISSGKTEPPGKEFNGEQKPNLIMGITADGSDVFFRSQDALVPGGGVGGVSAIFDARVGGGFAVPTAPSVCLEEGCRPPLTPPPLIGSAGSASLQGTGNVVPANRKHRKKKNHGRCAKAKGGTRCGSKDRSRNTPSQSSASGSPRTLAGPVAAEVGDSAQSSSASAAPGTSAATTPSRAAEFESSFGIKSVAAALSTASAGAHPDFTNTFVLKPQITKVSPKTENVTIKLPPGFLGNPNLLPRCTTGQLTSEACPIDSQVGIISANLIPQKPRVVFPVYNLAPPHPEREVARLGMTVATSPIFIDISVRTASDYGITATVHDAPGAEAIEAAETVIWGDPADPSHDEQRLTPTEGFNCPGTACEAPGGKRSTEELGPVAFFSNPSACQGGEVGFEITSYQLPGKVFSQNAPLPSIAECEGLPFAPSLEARPTTDVAGAPTGLKTSLKLPQSSDPSVRSTATMREAKVTLPPGMTINPSAADGLAACSDQQVHFHEEVDAECPDASKLGSMKVVSPALARPLEGAVYQRSPQPGHLFGLWLVTDELGLHVKIPGEVKPDPASGQLTAVFSGLPQVPVEEIELDVWGGARAPLKNPDTCGEYETTSTLTPWSSDPAARPSDRFLIDRAPDGGPCREQPNSPAFEAGTTRPVAGAFSPFLLRLHREDGSQPFGALELTLPPGLVGKLAGVAECPDAALAAAAQKSGREEQGAASCPPDSLIGTVGAAAGAGPSPFWTQGKAYLAGPYRGAPLSVAIVTPAVAGPFDLGDVVVRSALYVDPETARVTVKTAPLPTILEGVPLNLRTVVARLDRDQFILNGTSCEPLSFSGQLTSTLGSTAPLSERFQLGECGRLRFQPKLKLALEGGTRRADYPALSATLTTGGGNADLSSVTVALPHSEFLAQEHIVTICTRVQFAAHECPKGSVYGHAKAWTPLLAKPLEGPVYLRSSSHPLPDLVMDLRGQFEIAAVARIDSHHGGIRTSFETIPDAPVSKVVLKMKGGKKGLLTNSTDICQGRHRAAVKLQAHNGRRRSLQLPLVSRTCGKHHGHKRKHR